MAHPAYRTSRPRVAALAGLTGALLLTAAPVSALSGVDSTITDVCDTASQSVVALDPACEVTEQAVESLVAPITEQVEQLVAPVIDELPTDVLPLPADGEGEPVEAGAAPSPSQGSNPSSGSSGGSTTQPSGDTKVEAAGKSPVEVTEPQAPAAAADGRVAGGPTLQPTDLSAIGGNIAGVSSSTVTLQPLDSPLVSVPTDLAAPQVAGAPITTASPAIALAAEAITFAGETVLPQTSGQAAMVTATGLGLLAASGYVIRRRFETLAVGTLDQDIL